MIRTMKNAFVGGTLAISTLGLPVGCGGRSSSQELPMPPKATEEDTAMCSDLTVSYLHLISSAMQKAFPSRRSLLQESLFQGEAAKVGTIASIRHEPSGNFQITFTGYGMKSSEDGQQHSFITDGQLFIREDKATGVIDIRTEGEGLTYTMHADGLEYRFNTCIHWSLVEAAAGVIQQSGDVRFSGSQGHYAMFVPGSRPVEIQEAAEKPSGTAGWTANGKSLHIKLDEML